MHVILTQEELRNKLNESFRKGEKDMLERVAKALEDAGKRGLAYECYKVLATWNVTKV